MPSLRDKLNAMSSRARPAAPPPRVLEYAHEQPADAALFALDAEGFRRMAMDAPFDPEKAAFLDTETTGLSGGAGTVAFLVGVGRIEDGRFVVRQYLMNHYGAEPLLLEKVAQAVRGCECVVTFNGRTFDVPLLRSRYVMCRMEEPFGSMAHLDLIYPARRVWRLRLKDCSLSSLEKSELGIAREGDLPGSEVPARYFEYLKSQDIALLEDIIDHNWQDTLTLGALLVRLNRAYAAPLVQTSMMDVFSLGKAMEARGERETARRCYRLAANERPISTIERLRERHVAGESNRRLGLMLRRDRSFDQAETVFREMIARGQKGAFPYVELAKILEHKKGDPEGALALTEQALALAQPDEKPDLEKRRDRLRRRVESGVKS